jgi:hypothetical protein
MMARHRTLMGAGALLAAIFVTSCTSSSSTREGSTESAATATAAAPTVEQARMAGVVARAIEAEPNRTAEILAEHGMSAEGLEALIIEIARDPKLTEAYEEARRGASSG